MTVTFVTSIFLVVFTQCKVIQLIFVETMILEDGYILVKVLSMVQNRVSVETVMGDNYL